MFFDPLYLLLSLPALIIGIGSSLYLRYVYSRYSNEVNINGFNGIDTVTRIAQSKNFNVDIEQGFGVLTDYYDPARKIVSLSPDVAHRATVASVGIAAHEMGHVSQHHNSFLLITLRNLIVPIVNIGSTLGYILFVVGLFLSLFELAILGVILFSATTVFTLITLPVEIDASMRAVRFIEEMNLVDKTQLGGVRSVLFAAAMTYVAATIQSASNLIYFYLRAKNLDRD